jgi:predicted nucleotidyltransferase component of viral defense system
MEIYKQTVIDRLWDSLVVLMGLECLSGFRLVGGTSLSLLIGHRMSVDIDLFTDAEYGTIDFAAISEKLKSEFEYVDYNHWSNKSMGNSCFVGNSPKESIKLDLFYTDSFVYPLINFDGIRLSSLEEIVAMKLDVIGRGGRKKDFWDIHALFDYFELFDMFEFYSKRYPYNFSEAELISQLTNFKNADSDPSPNCLKGKYWELIKLDFEEKLSDYLQ